MIDDIEKAQFLLDRLKSALPIATRISPSLMKSLSSRSPDVEIPDRCNIIDALYMGDEGGIICCLDIGGAETKNPHLVSITHLRFDRNTPLFREIDVYQRHRIKKLKQQDARGY